MNDGRRPFHPRKDHPWRLAQARGHRERRVEPEEQQRATSTPEPSPPPSPAPSSSSTAVPRDGWWRLMQDWARGRVRI